MKSVPPSSPALRVVAWMRRPALDRALAGGVGDSALLRLRAEQLVRPATRALIADRIELALADAANLARFAVAPPLQRVAIALAHAELIWLIAALRTTPDPSPQAVAMALELVNDDHGPLYAPQTATALRNAAARIGAQLARSSVAA